jgi:hypothetical protein
MSRLAVCAPLVFICGCPAPQLPPVARPYPAPSAAEIFGALAARAAQVRSLRAEAKVDQGENGKRAKVTVSMLVARGGKLRLEAESALVGPVATLTSDGGEFQLLDVRNNRFLNGPARACNLARLLRIELEPEEAVAVLLGGAPLVGEPAAVDWDPSHGGREVLTLRTSDGAEEKLWLDARDRRWDVLEAERHDPGGAVRWRLRHEGFEEVSGVRLPTRTFVEEPAHHADAQLRFRSHEPNVELPANAFRLVPPTGITPEPVTCRAPGSHVI